MGHYIYIPPDRDAAEFITDRFCASEITREQAEVGLDHPRMGILVMLGESDTAVVAFAWDREEFERLSETPRRGDNRKRSFYLIHRIDAEWCSGYAESPEVGNSIYNNDAPF